MPTPNSQPKLVLVADDDPSIRELLIDLLSGEGYAVIAAENGSEAIRHAIESRPSLVLMDLMMPVVSGAEAANALRANPLTTTTPIVAMSAGRNISLLGDSVPADEFLSKPFDIDRVLEAVARYVAGDRA